MDLEVDDDEFGVAAKDALLAWPHWIHRRVESVHLLPGERGTRRVSLDCTPPPDPRLAYIAAERRRGDVDEVRGPLQVPMALVSKGAMRDLDVFDAEMRPLPVLGRRENSQFAVAALVELFRADLGSQGVEVTPSLRRTLSTLIHSSEGDAAPVVNRLLRKGVCIDDSPVCLDALSELTALWTQDLAANFLLIGLVPAAWGGRRQILKWSSNWQLAPEDLQGGRRLGIAAGYDVAEVALPIAGAASAASFHLEFHTPPELSIVRLTLPPIVDGDAPAASDETGNPVAHVHTEYSEVPEQQEALAYVGVPRTGARIVAAMATGVTGIALLLGCALPGARDVLRTSGSGVAALLLVAPALMISFSARSRESVAVSSLLAPLRAVTVGSALLLITAAASIVGGLVDPWYDLLWWVGTVLSSGLSAFLWLAPRSLSDLRERLRRETMWT